MVSSLTAHLQECPHKKERSKKVLKRDEPEILNTTDEVWGLLISLHCSYCDKNIGLSLGPTEIVNVLLTLD